MLTVELEKQISQLKEKSDFNPLDGEDDADEEWEPLIPHYAIEERARIADAFWGPGAEITTGSAAHAREVQVIRDLATLCTLVLTRSGVTLRGPTLPSCPALIVYAAHILPVQERSHLRV
ncbi:MAG: hypothetical protein M1815_004230 [Lichina confinis]|nr:MAG: hypothetical protein M1815_004230 [Lichina confinis]